MPFSNEVIGTVAAILTTSSFLPQAIQTMKSGNTKSISLMMYILYVSGIFLWIIFGTLINSQIIVVANSVTFLLAGTILLMKIKNYKKDKRV